MLLNKKHREIKVFHFLFSTPDEFTTGTTVDDRTTFSVPTTTIRTTPTETEIQGTSRVPIITDAPDTLDQELENLANVSRKYTEYTQNSKEGKNKAGESQPKPYL